MPSNPFKRILTPSSPIEGPRILHEKRELINFSSNDYLGIARHPRLIEGAIDAARRYGTSSSSSRLLTGTNPLHFDIEEQLKGLTGKECLLFNSGYQANMSLLGQIQGTLLLDHSSHRSLIEGAIHRNGTFKRFRHNDMDHLESLLKKCTGPVFIVTESLFSMEGDLAPLEELIALKVKYGAQLIVDDAHAFGVMGKGGMGLAACRNEIDISVATFGKALGSFGAFIACSKELKEQFIQQCPSFMYTTSLPPQVLGAIDAAIKLVPTLNQERDHLKKLYTMMKAPSQIVPYPMGNVERAVKGANALKECGLLALAIRPPTVVHPILRLSLTAAHSESDILRLQTHLDRLEHLV